MKYRCIIFSVLLPLALRAQTITIGPITKLAYCAGDTLFVPYQASGNFNPDNVFTVQLADSNGSFAHFTNVGQGTNVAGALPCPLTTLGQHFRVRIISSDPYEASLDNGTDISVSLLPTPSIAVRNASNPLTVRYKGFGMTGDFLTFTDTSTERAGSSYRWEFTGAPILKDSSGSSITAIYDTDGSQSVTVFVTNSNGCVGAYTSNFYIGTCHPVIPKTATIVTGYAQTMDYHDAYWVKSGGTLEVAGGPCPIIFAEPGSVVDPSEGYCSVFYIRSGASLTGTVPNGDAVFILPPDIALSYSWIHQIDTLYCGDLTFDYSQINASVAQDKSSGISARQSMDMLSVGSDGLPIYVRLQNLLGSEVLSRQGTGALTIDLSSLPAGVYFAIVESGGAWQERKILAVH